MMSSKYVEAADILIQLFLKKTEDAYTDIVFSPNLHSLNHLAWQVRNFGPLWTCSSIMFESANYLLKSKFTGTVNILPLIIERYHRNKETLKQNVAEDALADLCHQFRNTTKRFKRTVLDKSRLPFQFRNEFTPFYSNAKLTYFELDSVFHSTAINSYVTFLMNNATHCGQIQFFIGGCPEKVMIQHFEIMESYQCEKKIDLPIYSFHEVKESARVALINLHSVTEKLLRVDISERIYLVPLINMFEHD